MHTLMRLPSSTHILESTLPITLTCRARSPTSATRYNGATRGRIVTSASVDWLSGHQYGNRTGVAQHNGTWLTSDSSDLHGSGWVLSTDLRARYRRAGTHGVCLGLVVHCARMLCICTRLIGLGRSYLMHPCVVLARSQLALHAPAGTAPRAWSALWRVA